MNNTTLCEKSEKDADFSSNYKMSETEKLDGARFYKGGGMCKYSFPKTVSEQVNVLEKR